MKIREVILGIAAATMLAGCSSTKHVPDGEMLLDNVTVHIADTTTTFTEKEMLAYVHQRPNNKIFHFAKLRLGIYNMSGKDSGKWWNKWVRKLGEAPVLYSPDAAESDALQLEKAMQNAGYMHAKVETDSLPNHEKKRIKLQYNLLPGEPHIINSITYEFPNDTLRDMILGDSALLTVREGDRLDRNKLEQERDLISGMMKNRGYWAFSKDFITFSADTTEGSLLADLTMRVHDRMPAKAGSVSIDTHQVYRIRDIYVITDYDTGSDVDIREYQSKDTTDYRGLTILYGKKRYLRPSSLYENIYLKEGEVYRQEDVNNTYTALGRMQILKFTNIRLLPVATIDGTGWLDAYVLLTPGKSQNASIELEGTNSEGDFGVAAGINYTHRNIGNGAEVLQVKLRGSYEALTGNLEGFIHNRYLEAGVESSLTFPKFKFPLLKEEFKRKIKASTEIHLSMNYQERPEYTRIISTVGWSYKWSERSNRYRYTLTPIDVNYVYLPSSTENFIDQIAPDNPLLKYSYQDHFIMRAGFNFYYTNKRRALPWQQVTQNDISTWRVNVETAGNLLFALSSINHRSNFHEVPHKVFGINYSQYVRMDADYSYLHTFDKRNALACYAGFGIGVPYANSSIMPFEKRFYGGGANGVRGWDVRTLGPGRYPASNSVSDFIYQCGDIRLNLSVEYRAKLFWVLEGALFIDAGNIWTIRNYETQPYGQFKFNQFYKEIAAAYGIGLRLDFNYFLIRVDLGMKAHDPAINKEEWPLIHPNFRNDHSLHFSIGYPF
jgi:outer membrane protein assembly factor BamA